MQLERPRIDARRQRETPAFELALHALVEVQRDAGRDQEQREKCDAENPEEFIATPHQAILPGQMWLSRGSGPVLPVKDMPADLGDAALFFRPFRLDVGG